jgi:hypothetical protein
MVQEVYLLICSVLSVLLLRVGFCGSVFKDSSLLRCDAALLGRCSPVFQKNILPWSSRVKRSMSQEFVYSSPLTPHLWSLPLICPLVRSCLYIPTTYFVLACFMNCLTLEDEPNDVASHPANWHPAVLHAIAIGPSVLHCERFKVYKCEVIVYCCHSIHAFCFWDYKRTGAHFFCSLSLIFQLSYIYDVCLLAVNSCHDITIELLCEFHGNSNNIDIKMLVLMSLNLLSLTEGSLYDVKDSLLNQIYDPYHKSFEFVIEFCIHIIFKLVFCS